MHTRKITSLDLIYTNYLETKQNFQYLFQVIILLFRDLRKKIKGKSRFENSVSIGARQWPTDKIYWLPSAKNITMKYYCSQKDCGYKSNRSNNVKIHEETCKVETSINAKPGYLTETYNSIIFTDKISK